MSSSHRWHLLAAAAAGLFTAAGAQAQSSVTLYGLVDMSVGQFQDSGGKKKSGVESGKMTTSFIGFRGTEDLGGGLSAVFAIESFMRSDTGQAGRYDADSFWARSAYVGVASPYGTVTMGRNTTSLFVSTLLFNAFGDSFGFSPSIRHYFTSGTTTGDTGWSDSIKYLSPKWAGFSFTLHGALGEQNGGKNAGASAMYMSGPVGVSLAYQKVHKGATVDDTDTWQLGGSYDFTVVKLFGQYGQVKNDNTDNKYKLADAGVAVPIGPGKFLAQYGQISPDVGADRKTITVGYDYLVSKRTDLYANFMHDKIDGLDTGNSYAVGIRHKF